MIAQVEELFFESADFSHLAPIGDAILQLLDGKADIATAYNIQLAINEACANVIEHAYAERQGELTVTLRIEGDQFIAVLKEHGCSFNPNAIPNPDLDVLNEGGLGLFLMRELLDEFIYESRDGTNIWRLRKKIM